VCRREGQVRIRDARGARTANGPRIGVIGNHYADPGVEHAAPAGIEDGLQRGPFVRSGVIIVSCRVSRGPFCFERHAELARNRDERAVEGPHLGP
jgi:hypothetical protein